MKFKKLFAGVAAAATLLAGMAFGTGDHMGPFAFAGRDGDHGGNARLSGAGQHARLVFDKAGVIQMAVGIDQHGCHLAATATGFNLCMSV